MSRTWIVYNKPGEPNSLHAGLLLALGLHGFLRVLRITDIYQYLSEVAYFHCSLSCYIFGYLLFYLYDVKGAYLA